MTTIPIFDETYFYNLLERKLPNECEEAKMGGCIVEKKKHVNTAVS